MTSDCTTKRIRLPPLTEGPEPRNYFSRPTSLPSLSSLGLPFPSRQENSHFDFAPRRSSFSRERFSDPPSYRSSSFSKDSTRCAFTHPNEINKGFSDWSSDSTSSTLCHSLPSPGKSVHSRSSSPLLSPSRYPSSGSPPFAPPSPSSARPLPTSSWSSSTTTAFFPVASSVSGVSQLSLSYPSSHGSSSPVSACASDALKCPLPEWSVPIRYCLASSENQTKEEDDQPTRIEATSQSNKLADSLIDSQSDKDGTSTSPASSIRFHYFDPQVGKEVQMTVINDKFAEKNMFEKVPRDLKLTNVTFSELRINLPSACADDGLAKTTTGKRKHREILASSPTTRLMTVVRFPLLESLCQSSAESDALTDNRSQFLIGGEISKALSKKTFNVYRAMKLRGIGLYKLHQHHVDYLTCVGAVKKGTHSVVLVRVDDALAFINDWSPRIHK